jgi:hypothetical protein
MVLRHTVFKNAIPLEVCSYIKDFFDTRTDLHVHKPNNPNVIKINSPWTHLKEMLDPILSQYFKTANGQGGNIYKHTNLYSLHVDSAEPYQMINVNIPIHLEVADPVQHLVVFDQWVNNGVGKTWYGDRSDAKNYNFDHNKIASLTPWNDPEVHDKTDCNIDAQFYNSYLDFDNHKPDYFRGLTGTAYEWTPGSLIVFDSNNIHCTGKLVGPWKMGLLINFEGSLEELLGR